MLTESAHIDKLRSYLDAPEEIHLGRKPEDLLETLVNMVLGSPAICIYRSNGRSTARATSLAKVFVNNFNLPESTAIIDLAYGRCRDDNSHWQNVLKYCKDGCFQAMIDEYIHMLKETAGFQSDGNQYQIVHDMMMDSLKIHTATYIADTYPDFKKRINGADRKSDGCRIRSSYAVGFTKDAGDNSKVVMRKENIRNAFNSPMRPFVLATTSIGQEGLDFHNYCRVIMHWNLPSNPIDVGRRILSDVGHPLLQPFHVPSLRFFYSIFISCLLYHFLRRLSIAAAAALRNFCQAENLSAHLTFFIFPC